MILFLVGYAGSGKSSLAKRLSRRLGVKFIDTDKLVEEREGASIADIFFYQGEEYFRQAERSVVEDIIASGFEVPLSKNASSFFVAYSCAKLAGKP